MTLKALFLGIVYLLFYSFSFYIMNLQPSEINKNTTLVADII